jgi:ubiquinone/menaquinone biosynthesis methyltransferase
VKWERRFSSADRKREYVRRLFSTIAPRYDLITVLLSFGLDRRWKRRLADLVPAAGKSILDLACGTGDIAFEFASRRARQVVGLDITHAMLGLAARKTRSARSAVAFVAGDMTAVPFPDATFDVVTTGYGLRNVPRLEAALSEAARVLRPGGVLLSLDFNKPENRVVRRLYLAYLTVVGSALGMILHGDPDTYRYIAESIKRYPGSDGVRILAGSSGFARVDAYPVLGGLLTIHRAVK